MRLARLARIFDTISIDALHERLFLPPRDRFGRPAVLLVGCFVSPTSSCTLSLTTKPRFLQLTVHVHKTHVLDRDFLELIMQNWFPVTSIQQSRYAKTVAVSPPLVEEPSPEELVLYSIVLLSTYTWRDEPSRPVSRRRVVGMSSMTGRFWSKGVFGTPALYKTLGNRVISPSFQRPAPWNSHPLAQIFLAWS